MNGSGYLFDANVWVAMALAVHPHHARAVAAYTKASSERPACFCRATQQSFLRLLTTPAVQRLANTTGLSNRNALATLDRFMTSPSVAYREEPPGLVPTWHSLAALTTASPKVWMDAYLAAFAIAGGLELVTFGQAFGGFVGLTPTVLGAGRT